MSLFYRQYLCDESMEKKKETFDTSEWNLVNVKVLPKFIIQIMTDHEGNRKIYLA